MEREQKHTELTAQTKAKQEKGSSPANSDATQQDSLPHRHRLLWGDGSEVPILQSIDKSSGAMLRKLYLYKSKKKKKLAPGY